jgi:hypothetical protein
MGFTPAEVDAMSLWQFDCCCDGYHAAHSSPDEEEPLPTLSFDDFKQFMRQ